MRNTFLEFEQPLAELENKIEELRYVQTDSAVDISEEVGRLQQKNQALAKSIYAKLTPWQTALVARHPQRRSEELTSELQSLMRISYAVFCLKKKKNRHNNEHK